MNPVVVVVITVWDIRWLNIYKKNSMSLWTTEVKMIFCCTRCENLLLRIYITHPKCCVKNTENLFFLSPPTHTHTHTHTHINQQSKQWTVYGHSFCCWKVHQQPWSYMVSLLYFLNLLCQIMLTLKDTDLNMIMGHGYYHTPLSWMKINLCIETTQCATQICDTFMICHWMTVFISHEELPFCT